MRKRLVYGLVGTTVAAVVAAGTLTANAAWIIGGTANVKTRTVKIPKGTKPSVEDQSKAAVVSWSAQELVPGVKMDRYTVTAHSQDTPAKSAIVREVEASGGVSETVTFAAAEVAGGKWKWTVIPRYAKWVGAESGLSKALAFPAAPTAKAAETAPAAKTIAPTTVAPTPSQPTAETTSKPVTEPVITPPEVEPAPEPEKSDDKNVPPPASSPAVLEPVPAAPEPSASGSADEGIPK
ncbi:hypothetical protein OWR29_22095 [Actinoplanes sp. Pm04-4]|uniref:Uncharacterized protein n=1 Tax=Paractinoplanes pyxinae TaxID=2997416 RepID=A0ABT4B506_9ACTN|nr:hypothetical protein [Actinoplanes pyxinae]MCY1140698.1 hypothetical protein [Actinoplanes pyxinae]